MLSRLIGLLLVLVVVGTGVLSTVGSSNLKTTVSRESRVPEKLAIQAVKEDDVDRSGGLVRMLRRQLLRAEPWGPDRRLHRTAWTVLRYTEGLDGVQVDGVLEEAFDGAGVFDTLVFPVEAWSETLDQGIRSVAVALADDLDTASFNRLGVAAEETRDGWRVLALVARRQVEVNAHARAVPVGSTFELRGLMLEAKEEANIMVLNPDGAIRHQRAWIRGLQLGADIELDQPGSYRVEILLTGKEGVPEIPAALFTLYCGPESAVAKRKDALPRFRLRPNGGGKKNLSLETTREIWMRSMRLRRNLGLNALRRDTNLESLARTHARYLAANRTLAHVDSRGRGPFERVRGRGIMSGAIGENVAAGLSAEGIQQSLERSPSHLEQLLRNDITRMGVGTATRDGVVFVVQLFAGP